MVTRIQKNIRVQWHTTSRRKRSSECHSDERLWQHCGWKSTIKVAGSFGLSRRNDMPLAYLWFIHFQGQFPILRTNCPDVNHSSIFQEDQWHLTEGKSFFSDIHLVPTTLAVFYYLHLENVNRAFFFGEDKTPRNFSYLYGNSKPMLKI